jgi:nucleotide-binding universal stress UspA family protein
MGARRIVAWLAEDSWAATVDAAAHAAGPSDELVLLHVVDASVARATHAAFGGLLGRGGQQPDPGDTVEHLAADASARLLADAARRLGRFAARITRTGRAEREVIAALDRADLLICARDGDRSRLGPHTLSRHTHFVVDHAPCAVLLIWPHTAPPLNSIPPPPPRPR